MKTNKKKQLPLLLLALLLISFGAYGTKAYFTDSVKPNIGLKVKLGTLKINEEKNSWIGKRKEDGDFIPNENDVSSGSVFELAQPGDIFKKRFIVKNDGSLNQKVRMDISNLVEAINKLENEVFEFSANIVTPIPEFNSKIEIITAEEIINYNEMIKPFKLETGKTFEFDLIVKIKDDVGNKYNKDDSVNLDWLDKAITFTAVQEN